MRIIKPTDVSLISTTDHPLSFAGRRGERFQISLLEDDCIRVQHLPEGHPRLDRTWLIVGKEGTAPREGRSRNDLSPFSLPSFELNTAGNRISLTTKRLQLHITTGHFGLTWADKQGQVFASDQLDRAYTYDQQARTVSHYMVRRAGEHYYGFGEKSGLLDKRGRRMRMFNIDALGYNAETSDPLYKHFPFYITLAPELNIAYGLLYDNLATTTFDMGCEIDNYYEPFRYYQADDGDIDYYFIYGPTIAEVVQKLSKLTGRMALPPRWSLGFVASAWSPTEMPDAQDQLKRFVDGYVSHNMPCSLYQMSSGFSVMEQGKTSSGVDVRSSPRYVFHWNRSRIQAADADTPDLNMFWGGEGAYLDFTNPITLDWWKMQVREQLLKPVSA